MIIWNLPSLYDAITAEFEPVFSEKEARLIHFNAPEHSRQKVNAENPLETPKGGKEPSSERDRLLDKVTAALDTITESPFAPDSLKDPDTLRTLVNLSGILPAPLRPFARIAINQMENDPDKEESDRIKKIIEKYGECPDTPLETLPELAKEKMDILLQEARTELQKGGLSPQGIELHIGIIRNLSAGKTYFPDPTKESLPETRDPLHWQISENGRYIPRGRPTDAIRNLWESKNGIQCEKYSMLVVIKSVIDTANEEQLKLLDELMEGKEIPGDLPDEGLGMFFEKITPKDRQAFRGEELLPGDQIWFENPYYNRLSGKQQEHSIYRGEQGSNTFYAGNNRAMEIYHNHPVVSTEKYRQSMMTWYSVHFRNGREGGDEPSEKEFQIKEVRRPMVDWAKIESCVQQGRERKAKQNLAVNEAKRKD